MIFKLNVHAKELCKEGQIEERDMYNIYYGKTLGGDTNRHF